MLALCWPMWAANFPLGFAPENGPHQVSSFLWETQEKALFQGTWWGPFSGAKQSGKLPMWAPSWPRLGPMLALCWPMLAHLGAYVGAMLAISAAIYVERPPRCQFFRPGPLRGSQNHTKKKTGFLLSPRKKWDRPRPRNTVNSGVFVTSRTIHRKLQWRWQVGGWSEVGRRQGRPAYIGRPCRWAKPPAEGR